MTGWRRLHNSYHPMRVVAAMHHPLKPPMGPKAMLLIGGFPLGSSHEFIRAHYDFYKQCTGMW